MILSVVIQFVVFWKAVCATSIPLAALYVRPGQTLFALNGRISTTVIHLISNFASCFLEYRCCRLKFVVSEFRDRWRAFYHIIVISIFRVYCDGLNFPAKICRFLWRKQRFLAIALSVTFWIHTHTKQICVKLLFDELTCAYSFQISLEIMQSTGRSKQSSHTNISKTQSCYFRFVNKLSITEQIVSRVANKRTTLVV